VIRIAEEMSSVFLIALCIVGQLDLPGLAVITAMTSESLAKIQLSATKVLAKMEELALTVMEVIHANAKMDGQAIIVTKI